MLLGLFGQEFGTISQPDLKAAARDVATPGSPRPKSGRFAVKVFNHVGNEVMKVFRVKELTE